MRNEFDNSNGYTYLFDIKEVSFHAFNSNLFVILNRLSLKHF